MNRIFQGDNLSVLTAHPAKYECIYIDPPFNSGKVMKHTTMVNGEYGETSTQYNDKVERSHYLAVMGDLLYELHEQLTDNGSIFIHLDDRMSHYVKVAADEEFGYNNFMNEIIWAWDYGARTTKKWPRKHNSILWYVNNPDNYIFNIEESDRIEYMSPKLVGAEKTERGKTPTDTWWMTIEPTRSKTRFGYATEKPYKLMERIIKVHSNPDDNVLDCFAGSGKFGLVAYNLERNFTMIDNNPQSIEIMKQVFAENTTIQWS